ncbi:MAG: preprotein translocase subunit SecG [Firmicutes bacterium ADurb.Bin193]|nr:MAG: preprotein translocase subunit SecG [Firmicutes bacterium ADurb.Bin193]
MSTAVTILHILVAVILIVIVLLQSGKSFGLSGSIAGGAETFFGKNKGRTIDAMLNRLTTVVAVIFLITSIVLAFIK